MAENAFHTINVRNFTFYYGSVHVCRIKNTETRGCVILVTFLNINEVNNLSNYIRLIRRCKFLECCGRNRIVFDRNFNRLTCTIVSDLQLTNARNENVLDGQTLWGDHKKERFLGDLQSNGASNILLPSLRNELCVCKVFAGVKAWLPRDYLYLGSVYPRFKSGIVDQYDGSDPLLRRLITCDVNCDWSFACVCLATEFSRKSLPVLSILTTSVFAEI